MVLNEFKMFTNKKDKEREKKFLKLKQLDRIEYVMEIRNIREYFQGTFSEVLNLVFILNIVLFLFATIFLIAFKTTTLIQVSPIIFKASLILLTFSLFFDIIKYTLKSKAIFELRKRFNLNSRD